jgi:hypothetical protein
MVQQPSSVNCILPAAGEQGLLEHRQHQRRRLRRGNAADGDGDPNQPQQPCDLAAADSPPGAAGRMPQFPPP